MNDVRTLDAQHRRRAWAARWVRSCTFRMKAADLAAAFGGFTTAAVQAAGQAMRFAAVAEAADLAAIEEVEEMWADLVTALDAPSEPR